MITVVMRKQRTLSSYVHFGKQLDSKFLLVPESVEVLEVEVPIVELPEAVEVLEVEVLAVDVFVVEAMSYMLEISASFSCQVIKNKRHIILSFTPVLPPS